jgi:hypothetical protein
VAAAIALLARPAPVPAVEADVLEGGFRLFDPDSPRGRDAALLSMGPLVLAGARARSSLGNTGTDICQEIIFMMLGAKGTVRGEHTLRLKQKDDVLVFFVFYECVGEDESCVSGTSNPVAVSGCSGSLKLDARSGVRGGVNVRCKDGIDASDAAFGLSAEQQGWLDQTFPELGKKFRIKFRDKSGEEVTGADLDFKIRNFDIDAFDDIVGTFLEDDSLPACAE